MKYLILVLVPLLLSCGRGPAGPKGDTGARGAQGVAGVAGVSCTVLQDFEGAWITCGDQEAYISDGANGFDGQNGKDAQPAQIVPFCPEVHGGIGYRESGIKYGSQIIAVYYDGSHTFLTPLQAGQTYVTTDGRGCTFTVTADGSIQ